MTWMREAREIARKVKERHESSEGIGGFGSEKSDDSLKN